MPKKTVSLKLDPELIKRVAQISDKLGRERQDMIREALSIGLPVLEMPEYYQARLNGVDLNSILREVRAALKKG